MKPSPKGPVKPDIGVRLALAFLHACGTSGDRRSYDEFWRLLRDPGIEGQHEEQRNYIRRTYADSCIKGIIRDVGAPESPDFWNALHAPARSARERETAKD